MHFQSYLRFLAYLSCILLLPPVAEARVTVTKMIASPFPDTNFSGAEGNPVNITHFKGTPILVNLWATWCTPCIREMPQLHQLQEKYGDQLKILAISIDQKGFDTINVFKEKQGDWKHPTFYAEPTLQLYKRLRIRGLPTSYLIDTEGMTLIKIEGELDWLGEEAENLFNLVLPSNK